MEVTDQTLIDLQNCLQVAHHVPGRIRVKFDAALARNLPARELFSHYQRLSWMVNYRLNLMAQSVVIEYDRERISPAEVQEFFTTRDPQRLQALVDDWSGPNRSG